MSYIHELDIQLAARDGYASIAEMEKSFRNKIWGNGY